jgi:Ni,Fe-hydrogenase III large subunit
MTTVRLFGVHDIPLLDPRAWRDSMEAALRDGARPLTLFGRANDGGRRGVIITAVLESESSELAVLRTVVDPDSGYHSFTPDHAAMHCFERELHEQHGVRIAGHPWLKAIRFEHTGPAGRDTYGFYEIKGKEVHEVAVGPIHAGVIEPGSFRFMCLGEQVHHLEIHLGYQHRGVEQLLLGRNPRTLAPLVETIAGDSSIAHTWAYSAALEALADMTIAPEIDAARGVMLELERVAMHLAGLAGMAGDVGFLQGASTYGRLRTTAINTSMRLCGSRFGRGAIRAGGLGARLEPKPNLGHVAEGGITLGEVRRNLKLLTEDVAIINDCFLAARTVRHRLEGVGVVTTELATQIGLVGMAARASGVARDLRATSGGIYKEQRIETCTESSGDCWARALLRIAEINRSIAWIDAVTDSYQRWHRVRSPIGALSPRHLAIAMIEGWRGEVVHALETDSEGALVHYKVQDPSFRNWLGLALAVRDNEISDFPICNKSFDLSYCGNDL